jgi:hypothetical protein
MGTSLPIATTGRADLAPISAGRKQLKSFYYLAKQAFYHLSHSTSPPFTILRDLPRGFYWPQASSWGKVD